jgi:hypothetical protein
LLPDVAREIARRPVFPLDPRPVYALLDDDSVTQLLEKIIRGCWKLCEDRNPDELVPMVAHAALCMGVRLGMEAVGDDESPSEPPEAHAPTGAEGGEE